MELKLEEMLNKVIDQLQTVAKTETVIGESFKLGEFECVPVIKIGMGFGSGGGGDEISMVSVSRSKGLQSIFEKVPDLIEKLIQMKKDKEPQKKK